MNKLPSTEDMLIDVKWQERIAELEQQNAELVAALELCKKHMSGDKWDSLFIDGVLSKVKP